MKKKKKTEVGTQSLYESIRLGFVPEILRPYKLVFLVWHLGIWVVRFYR